MVKKKPFEDQVVRKAVNLALHRQQINDILRDYLKSLPTYRQGEKSPSIPLLRKGEASP